MTRRARSGEEEGSSTRGICHYLKDLFLLYNKKVQCPKFVHDPNLNHKYMGGTCDESTFSTPSQ